jgi:hypothetical protein
VDLGGKTNVLTRGRHAFPVVHVLCASFSARVVLLT